MTRYAKTLRGHGLPGYAYGYWALLQEDERTRVKVSCNQTQNYYCNQLPVQH